ncbi:MAG: metallophosphoesterase [Elusimicrobiales bacterium]|nr:metallophosphoesterase [Elusimicrobiales bacterium]
MQSAHHKPDVKSLREAALKLSMPKKRPVLKNRRRLHGRDKELVAVGDLHGELDGILEILLHAGLIDFRARWKGGNKTLVQLGDVIDRGPHSMDVNNLLARLQREAELKGGKVVRLLGNHELELLRGNAYLTTLPPEQAGEYRRRLAGDILNGNVLAAYSQQGYLFTHAGLTGEMLSLLARSDGPLPSDEAGLADLINKITAQALMRNDYSHSIFNIGASRGGRYRHGGIFWEDVRLLFASEGAAGIKQVVGHTPLKRVIQSEGGRLTALDVGIYKGYGGGRAYIRMKRGRISIVELALPAVVSILQ